MPFTCMAGRFIMSTIRRMIAMSTGPPTIRPRNTVRRDHNISPSDTSNTRSDAVISDGSFVGLSCGGGASAPPTVVDILDS